MVGRCGGEGTYRKLHSRGLVMAITVRSAIPDDLPQLVAHLDQEFVFGKEREISLARRFPTVFCQENADNIFVLEEKGQILSCLASKSIWLNCANTQWQGVMIGTVYTHPNRRGEHLGSHLLEKATCELRNRGMDFAVLWTDQSGFYARLGWRPSDPGVIGNFECRPIASAFNGEISELPLQSSIAITIERIRKQWLGCRTVRKADDYRTLPLPAESANVLFVKTGIDECAYALIGNFRTMGIIYEMIGHPSAYSALWGEICRRHKRILANDQAGSPTFKWLSQHTEMNYQNKALAMWQLFSGKLNLANTAQWYVPYFDRI